MSGQIDILAKIVRHKAQEITQRAQAQPLRDLRAGGGNPR